MTKMASFPGWMDAHSGFKMHSPLSSSRPYRLSCLTRNPFSAGMISSYGNRETAGVLVGSCAVIEKLAAADAMPLDVTRTAAVSAAMDIRNFFMNLPPMFGYSGYMLFFPVCQVFCADCKQKEKTAVKFWRSLCAAIISYTAAHRRRRRGNRRLPNPLCQMHSMQSGGKFCPPVRCA